MLKAGILFPRSGIFPLLGNDMLGGIRSFLRYSGIDQQVELLMEPVGYGADKKEAYQKVEHLLLMDQVDIIIAFLDLKVGATLYPLVTALQKPLILVNPGANYAENWVAPDNLVLLTLQDALLCRMAGIRAGTSGETEAAFAISYYDGGYHHGHAMVTPFIEGGGKLIYNYVSPLKTSEFTIEPLERVLEERPNLQALLAIFSGEESNRFLSELAAIKNSSELRLYVSPQMLEAETIEKLGVELPFEMHAYLPWHKEIQSEENKVFIEALKADTNRPANIFSLLGWESGQLLKRYLTTDPGKRSGKQFYEDLLMQRLVTPRGELLMDEVSHNLVGPAYEAVFNSRDLKIGAQLKNEACMEEWKRLMKSGEIETASGWLNTYLCY